MSSILIKNAQHVITMDDDGTEISNGNIAIRDSWIESVGSSTRAGTFDETIDASAMLALPGFINVHHHLYQSLTRGFPESEGKTFFPWLEILYPIWAGIDEDGCTRPRRWDLAELMLSGCTTSSDHLYLHPRGHDTLTDVEIEAGLDLGNAISRDAWKYGLE